MYRVEAASREVVEKLLGENFPELRRLCIYGFYHNPEFIIGNTAPLVLSKIQDAKVRRSMKNGTAPMVAFGLTAAFCWDRALSHAIISIDA